MNRRILLVLLAGFVLGALWLVALRFFSYKDNSVHYHANFALYIKGERDMFDNFTFYEEVQSCGSDEVNNPKTRVHMHDNVPHVVHVHDNAVTWGDFFANLGYGLTNKTVVTDNGVYVDGENGVELHFILNGEAVDSIANRIIGNEDLLSVVVGQANELFVVPELQKDAHEYNEKSDPSSCAGSRPLTFTERLREATGIGQ